MASWSGQRLQPFRRLLPYPEHHPVHDVVLMDEFTPGNEMHVFIPWSAFRSNAETFVDFNLRTDVGLYWTLIFQFCMKMLDNPELGTNPNPNPDAADDSPDAGGPPPPPTMYFTPGTEYKLILEEGNVTDVRRALPRVRAALPYTAARGKLRVFLQLVLKNPDDVKRIPVDGEINERSPLFIPPSCIAGIGISVFVIDPLYSLAKAVEETIRKNRFANYPAEAAAEMRRLRAFNERRNGGGGGRDADEGEGQQAGGARGAGRPRSSFQPSMSETPAFGTGYRSALNKPYVAYDLPPGEKYRSIDTFEVFTNVFATWYAQSGYPREALSVLANGLTRFDASTDPSIKALHPNKMFNFTTFLERALDAGACPDQVDEMQYRLHRMRGDSSQYYACKFPLPQYTWELTPSQWRLENLNEMLFPWAPPPLEARLGTLGSQAINDGDTFIASDINATAALSSANLINQERLEKAREQMRRRNDDLTNASDILQNALSKLQRMYYNSNDPEAVNPEYYSRLKDLTRNGILELRRLVNPTARLTTGLSAILTWIEKFDPVLGSIYNAPPTSKLCAYQNLLLAETLAYESIKGTPANHWVYAQLRRSLYSVYQRFEDGRLHTKLIGSPGTSKSNTLTEMQADAIENTIKDIGGNSDGAGFGEQNHTGVLELYHEGTRAMTLSNDKLNPSENKAKLIRQQEISEGHSVYLRTHIDKETGARTTIEDIGRFLNVIGMATNTPSVGDAFENRFQVFIMQICNRADRAIMDLMTTEPSTSELENASKYRELFRTRQARMALINMASSLGVIPRPNVKLVTLRLRQTLNTLKWSYPGIYHHLRPMKNVITQARIETYIYADHIVYESPLSPLFDVTVEDGHPRLVTKDLHLSQFVDSLKHLTPHLVADDDIACKVISNAIFQFLDPLTNTIAEVIARALCRYNKRQVDPRTPEYTDALRDSDAAMLVADLEKNPLFVLQIPRDGALPAGVAAATRANRARFANGNNDKEGGGNNVGMEIDAAENQTYYYPLAAASPGEGGPVRSTAAARSYQPDHPVYKIECVNGVQYANLKYLDVNVPIDKIARSIAQLLASNNYRVEPEIIVQKLRDLQNQTIRSHMLPVVPMEDHQKIYAYERIIMHRNPVLEKCGIQTTPCIIEHGSGFFLHTDTIDLCPDVIVRAIMNTWCDHYTRPRLAFFGMPHKSALYAYEGMYMHPREGRIVTLPNISRTDPDLKDMMYTEPVGGRAVSYVCDRQAATPELRMAYDPEDRAVRGHHRQWSASPSKWEYALPRNMQARLRFLTDLEADGSVVRHKFPKNSSPEKEKLFREIFSTTISQRQYETVIESYYAKVARAENAQRLLHEDLVQNVTRDIVESRARKLQAFRRDNMITSGPSSSAGPGLQRLSEFSPPISLSTANLDIPLPPAGDVEFVSATELPPPPRPCVASLPVNPSLAWESEATAAGRRPRSEYEASAASSRSVAPRTAGSSSAPSVSRRPVMRASDHNSNSSGGSSSDEEASLSRTMARTRVGDTTVLRHGSMQVNSLASSSSSSSTMRISPSISSATLSGIADDEDSMDMFARSMAASSSDTTSIGLLDNE